MSILDDFALTYSIYNATFSANTEINVSHGSGHVGSKSAFQDTGVRSHHRPGIRRNVN